MGSHESRRVEVNIPYSDLSSLHAPLKEELLESVSRVLDSNDLVGGDESDLFEQRFAAMVGVAHGVSFSSGSDALELTLRAMGLQYGEEVITVPNAPVATVGAIALAGGTPVFVDVGPDYNIDPSRIEDALTLRTRAIIATHLTGRPAPMDELNALAAKRGLIVIEDAGQALLARYRGRLAGALGTVAFFSLDQSNPLGACGAGGIVTTGDSHLVERLRTLRGSGQIGGETAYWAGDRRLDAVQAAMLLVKLKWVATWTDRRRQNAVFYQEALSGLEDLFVPRDRDWEDSAYQAFVVQTKRRDDLKAFLAGHGIGSDVPWCKPLHLQPVSSILEYRVEDFPCAEAQSRETLGLPVGSGLADEHRQRVVDNVRMFFT